MALEAILQETWNRINKVTDPDWAKDKFGNNIAAAAEAVRKDYVKSPAEGPALIDKFDEFSKIYLTALGIGPARNDSGVEMKRILGDNYGQVLRLLKNGTADDIDKALDICKEAYYSNKRRDEIVDLVWIISPPDGPQILSPEQRLELGKHMVEAVASLTGKILSANDYVAAIANPSGYMNALSQTKAAIKQMGTLWDPFNYKSPAAPPA